jgi:hypothetical protein
MNAKKLWGAVISLKDPTTLWNTITSFAFQKCMGYYFAAHSLLFYLLSAYYMRMEVLSEYNTIMAVGTDYYIAFAMLLPITIISLTKKYSNSVILSSVSMMVASTGMVYGMFNTTVAYDMGLPSYIPLEYMYLMHEQLSIGIMAVIALLMFQILDGFVYSKVH